MNYRFRIDIAFEENEQMYYCNLYSITDDNGIPIKNSSLRKLLVKINKFIREKNAEVKHFPIPEQSLIIAPNGKGDINLIVPAHN